MSTTPQTKAEARAELRAAQLHLREVNKGHNPELRAAAIKRIEAAGDKLDEFLDPAWWTQN